MDTIDIKRHNTMRSDDEERHNTSPTLAELYSLLGAIERGEVPDYMREAIPDREERSATAAQEVKMTDANDWEGEAEKPLAAFVDRMLVRFARRK